MSPYVERAVSVPLPHPWGAVRQEKKRWVLISATSGIFLLAGAIMAGVALLNREWGTVVTGVLVSLLFGGFMVVALRTARGPRFGVAVAGTVEGLGVVFPFSRTLWRATAGLWLVLPVVGGLGAVSEVVSSDGAWSLRAVVLAALGLVGLVQWFNLATGRLRRGELRLTPDGLTLRTWGDEIHLSWPTGGVRSSPRPVTPATGVPSLRVRSREDTDTTRRSHAPLMSSQSSRHLPDLVVRADAFEGCPAVVAHAVAHYRRHPERRAELASDAALERVLAGEATVPRLDAGDV